MSKLNADADALILLFAGRKAKARRSIEHLIFCCRFFCCSFFCRYLSPNSCYKLKVTEREKGAFENARTLRASESATPFLHVSAMSFSRRGKSDKATFLEKSNLCPSAGESLQRK